MPDINIEKKLNELRKSSKKTRKDLNGMLGDMPGYKERYDKLWSQRPDKKKADYDEQIKKWSALSKKLNNDSAKYEKEKKQHIEKLRNEIITTQALMTLKSQNKETVTQEELNEAIEKEVFVFQALDSSNTSMLINISQHPDRLFSIKEQFKKEYPMYEKNVNLRDIKYVFNKEKPKNSIENYSTSRSAALSIALLTLANKHQFDLETLKTEQQTQLYLMEKYRNYVTSLSTIAKRHFNLLNLTLRNHDTSEQSGDFIKMYNAVKAASNLNEDSTPADVERAINQMADSSNEYIRKNNRKNDIFLKEDKRLIAAKNIQNLSKDASMKLLYGMSRDKNTEEYVVPNNMTSLITDKNKSIKENKKEIEDSLNLLRNLQGQLQGVRNNQAPAQVVQAQVNQAQVVQAQGGQQNALKRTRSVDYSRAGHLNAQPNNAHPNPEQRNRANSVVIHKKPGGMGMR